MTRIFPIHDEEVAPEASRPALAATRVSFGMIPNLERVMASAPALPERIAPQLNRFAMRLRGMNRL